MNLDQIGNIGEAVGAIAVVGSLVYLAVQLRQNTRTVRAATHQAIVTSTATCNATLTTSKELARVFRIGSDDPDGLDEDERVQFAFLCAQLFDIFENLYLQRLHETLDDDFWLPRANAYLGLFSMPGIANCWELRRHDYAQSFTLWLEGQLVGHSDERARSRILLAKEES